MKQVIKGILPASSRLQDPAFQGMLVAAFIFGSFSVLDFCIKLMTQYVPVITIIFFVNLGVALCALSVGLFKLDLIKTKRLWFHLVRGIIFVILSYSVFNSFDLLGVSVAYSIIFLSPIFNALFSHLFLNETPSRTQSIGIVVGFIGVLIALRPGFTKMNIGHLFALITALGFSLNGVITRKYARDEPLMPFSLYAQLLVCIVFFIPMIQTTDFQSLPFHYYILMLLLGAHLFINTIGLIFAIQNTTLTVVGSFQYGQFIWIFLLEIIFLSLYPSLWLLIGASIIIFSGLMVNNPKMFRGIL